MRQIVEEKGLSFESVMETVESALAAAYRKDFGAKNQNIEVQYELETGRIRAFDVKMVVENMDLEEIEKTEELRKAKQEERNIEVKALVDAGKEVPLELQESVEVDGPTFNEKTEIMLAQAVTIDDEVKVGEELRMELPVPGEFGRMAAQTAKQVVMQKLREAEREVIFNEFKEFEHTIVMGTIQRREGRAILVDVGRATGIIRPEDQVPGERYNQGSRMKFYVRSVMLTSRGPEILLSRTDNDLVRELFTTEIPEIAEGVVEVRGMAREPGNRTKVAVWTSDESIDPIGACIGQRGTRIQTIIAELGGEKIDIVHWTEDLEDFVSAALSPAKVERVEIIEGREGQEANVIVAEDQLSLAVGRGGQNVRLASRLTDIRINIIGAEKKEVEGEEDVEVTAEEVTDEEAPEEKTTGEEVMAEESVEDAS